MTTLRADEASVEARSASLKRELGLTDLVLTQILFIVGLPWVGVAAKQGPSHVVFWLIALTLFYVPSAVVVIYLNRLMPLEGGLYQWAKLGFNELTGFPRGVEPLAVRDPQHLGDRAAGDAVSGLHRRARVEWLAGSRWFIGLVSTAIIGGAGRRHHRRAQRRQVGAQGRRRADARDLRARCSSCRG